jgi:hypothetical protein
VAHVIVENQIAMGDATVVPATLNSLMREGLNRHDAIHAIASIHMGIVFDVMTEKDDGGDINTKYGRELFRTDRQGLAITERLQNSQGVRPYGATSAACAR